MAERIAVIVRTRSARPRLETIDGALHAWVAAAPVRGAANEELRELIAKHVGVPRGDVRLVSGHSSRRKVFEIVRAKRGSGAGRRSTSHGVL